MSEYFDSTGTPLYSEFISKSRYAKWLEAESRRENWDETVDRYRSFFGDKIPEGMEDEFEEAMMSVTGLEVMPSMRALMTAGKALARDNVAGFNCSFAVIDHPKVFDEILYILMCGTGVGFSVERQYVSKLPEVAEEFHPTDTVISVRDSRIGWAASFRELVSLLYSGSVPSWDLSKLRPAGAPLKTFGGRSSGPEPLDELMHFTVAMFKKSAGRRLSSLECHDLVCKIAEVVVVGGVRRSALISLSNLSDDRMRGSKTGQWWLDNGQRRLANNSACYTERPEFPVFLKEWMSLYESKSGERGVFSRVAAKKQAAKNGRRDTDHDFGTNPCSEIILRPNQFCNLSEVVVRPKDTLDALKRKVRLATILGTMQSTLVDFRYLRKIWKQNTEEERLLGVSLTGIMDHPTLSNPDNQLLKHWLTELKQEAIETNERWADALGIARAAAITCVKPSGTVSQLVNSASGIHPRFSEYYIRRVRADKKDPLARFMQEKGFPCEQDVRNSDVLVFSFPVRAPKNSIQVKDVGPMHQLRLWSMYQEHWCEHKPSITVYYENKDFLEIGSWLWNNFDAVSGVSFLPYSDHTYAQAPYEDITEERYLDLAAEIPAGIDWAELGEYEHEDRTAGSHTLACSGGVCEVVDLVSAE